jgi:hypothetical protein
MNQAVRASRWQAGLTVPRMKAPLLLALVAILLGSGCGHRKRSPLVSLKAADGSRAYNRRGDYARRYTNPPPTYRSPEGFQALRWGMSRAEVAAVAPLGRELTPVSVEILGLSVLGMETTGAAQFATKDRLAGVSLMLRPDEPFSAALQRVRDGVQAKFIGVQVVQSETPESWTWRTGESAVVLRKDPAEDGLIHLFYRSGRLGPLLQELIQHETDGRSLRDAADL